MITRNSVRLGRVLGVELRLDFSWLILLVLVVRMIARGHLRLMHPGWDVVTYWVVGGTVSILFFVSVVAHELADGAVSRAVGVPVREITLFILGGAGRASPEVRRARHEFLIAAAGPAMSLVLSGGFWTLERLSAEGGPFHASAGWLALTNLVFAVFNLVPEFPMDGGRVFRAILWGMTGNFQRATRIAALDGRVVGYAFIFWGVRQISAGNLLGGLWVAFVGWCLDSSAMRRA